MSEENLISDFNVGVESAFKIIFDMFYAKILFFVIKMIDNKSEAEDIVLISFQLLFNKCDSFEGIDRIKAFLYITAKNRCVNYLNRQKRTTLMNSYFKKMQDDKSFTYEYSIKDDLIDRINNAIETLPGECKRIFKLLHFDQLSPSEVAKKLNISVNTVNAQKHRAINHLKVKFNGNAKNKICN